MTPEGKERVGAYTCVAICFLVCGIILALQIVTMRHIKIYSDTWPYVCSMCDTCYEIIARNDTNGNAKYTSLDRIADVGHLHTVIISKEGECVHETLTNTYPDIDDTMLRTMCSSMSETISKTFQGRTLGHAHIIIHIPPRYTSTDAYVKKITLGESYEAFIVMFHKKKRDRARSVFI